MSEEKKTRKKMSPEERLAKIETQRTSTLKHLVKEIVSGNPKFVEMKDSYLKTNKWLHEAKLIVSSHEESVATIKKQLDALNAKHKIAMDTIIALQSSADSYSSVMQKLGEELSNVMSDPATTSEQLTAKAEQLLAKYIAEFKPASDPFKDYRKKD